MLALNFEKLNIFYLTLVSLPLSLSILYDTLYKQDTFLNKTLAKISTLLILDCILLAIGIYI